MNIYEIFGLIAAAVGLIAAVATIVSFMWNLKKDLLSKFDVLNIRIDKLDIDMRDQGKRIDHLYSMFVDLVSKLK